MKKVIDFFKNRIVISVIGLVILALLIWFAGPHIKFGTENTAPLGSEIARLLLIMFILVLWGVNNLRIAFHDKKQNNELLSDLQHNQENPHSIITEQSSEELHIINQRFTNALDTLKKLKFRGKGKRKALYELPWYIIIGPPGSGKTTALINSSLEFPLADKFGKEALHGVGGTRNCDWWFTNEAVLIDTAGRYTTQDSHKVLDSSAWDGFLGLLKKNRRRRPINGVLIAISLQDLLSQTEEERAAHARTIRARIDELMNKLEIRFPIYVLFTKTDLVSGFTEFYSDLDKEDREQVWGVSLPDAPGAGQSPDTDYLDTEYDNLLKRLYERVLQRVHQERDINRRGLIQGFPLQMENLKEITLQFVRQTFIKNRYQFQPYLRGVYFTSGTQDGTPIDRLMSTVSSNFGFDRQLISNGLGTGKSFFLGRLFREVIFPESELVGSNRKYESFIRWSQRATLASLALIMIVMLTIWAGSFTRHEMYMHEVESYIADFKAEQKRIASWSNDIRKLLPSLNALAKASSVYDQEAHPWLTSLGMYDGSVDSAADIAYANHLKEVFMPLLLQYIEMHLRNGHRGGDLYDNFRIYMMFGKTAHKDDMQIIDWFKTRWDQEFMGQGKARVELNAHLQALLQLHIQDSQLDKHMVSAIRTQILRIPVSQRIYSRIRTNPTYSSKVNLLNEFGESVRAIYVLNENVMQHLEIPVLFTRQVYDEINISPESEMISNLAREKWIMSDDDSANVDFLKEDLDKITDKVKEHYYAEYRTYWMKMYEAIDIRPFRDIRDANEVLANFTDPVYSPLVSILQVGAANTTLTNQMAANIADDNKEGKKGKALNMLASQINLTPVDKQFRELNQLLRESKDRPSQLQNILQKVRQVQEFVNEIIVAPEPGKKSFEIARARYQSGAGNAITGLMTYSKSLPEPVDRWLNALAQQTWKVILDSAHGYINTEWQSQVVTPCRTALSNRYPLNSNSNTDIAMYDFTEFFKPGGTVDKFTNEYVIPFVDVRSGWKNRGIDNFSIGFSSGMLSQVKIAQAIRSVFFAESASMPGLTFQLRPADLSKNDARFTLELGGKRLSYSHGPKFWNTLSWSGDDENHRVRVIFEDLSEQQHSVTYDGPWAWFRLQDKSKLASTSIPNIYQVTYTASNGHVSGSELSNTKALHSVSFEIKAKSVNNPFNNDLLRSFQCVERI